MQTPKKSNLELSIIILAFASILMPISWGYFAAFLMLVWIISTKSWQNFLTVGPRIRDRERPSQGSCEFLFRPISVGILLAWVLVLIASLAGLALKGFDGASGELHDLVHFTLKYPVLWFVISSFFVGNLSNSEIFNRVIKLFSIYLVFYFVYLLFQRFLGIDWIRGFDARLGLNRFAHGVYRLSGFMSHPLTFSYNLLQIFLWALALLRLERQSKSLNSKSVKYLFGISLIVLVSLVLTGSRWPIVCLLASIFAFAKIENILKNRFFWLFLPFVFLLLYMEGSTLSRVNEVFDGLGTIEEKFQRLVFWKVHIRIFLDHPFFGAGLKGLEVVRTAYYAAFPNHDKMYSAHNVLFHFTAQSGIFGLFALIALFGGFVVSARRMTVVSGMNLLRPSVLVMFLAGCMQNTLTDSEYLFALWLLTAFLLTFTLASFSTLKSIDAGKKGQN